MKEVICSKCNSKLILILVILLAMSMCACSSTEAIDDQMYEAEIQQEYYAAGMQEAFAQIRSAARSDFTIYIDSEQLEDVLKDYFGDEADEIRDCLFSELEGYSASDILNNFTN